MGNNKNYFIIIKVKKKGLQLIYLKMNKATVDTTHKRVTQRNFQNFGRYYGNFKSKKSY